MTPRVSIITPYLDPGEHFRAAIASVETQTVGDWEMLLIDDGSRDHSRAIAEEAASRDARIISLVRPKTASAGAAGARNWGLAQSRGEYIVFLDADDCFLPAKIETELALMDRHPSAAMVIGACLWWYPLEQSRNWSDRCSPRSVGMIPAPKFLDKAILLQRLHVPCITAVMVRRCALPTDEPFETSFALYEDQTLLAKMLANYPAYLGRHVVALYRHHDGSSSAAAERAGMYQRTSTHPARGAFLRWIGDYLEQRGPVRRSTERALRLARAMQSDGPSNLGPIDRAALLRLRASILAGKILRRLRSLVFARESWAVSRPD